MRIRVLIGLGLALLVVVAVVVYPWRSPDSPFVPGLPSLSKDGRPAAGAAGSGDPYFPRAGNGGYDVAGYDIQIRYDPATGRLEGQTTITAQATESLSRFNLDLRLAASAVTVDDQPAEIRQEGGELQVTPAQPVLAGQSMVVRVDYAGVPSDIPRDGDGATEPWRNTADGAVAAGEPESAAWWYPSNDHPSDKATVAVTATVPTGVEAISNGALLGGPEPAEPGWEKWRWQAKEPMATYLAFIAIGQYDIVRRDTPFGPYLAAYAQGLDPEIAAAARSSIERTPEVASVLAEIFGPYPFSNLGGVAPNAPTMGFALETQTRPVYGPAFFIGGENIRVVVHEQAHQWFGDTVSVRQWRDIWLNEGFATYAEWLYAERTGGLSAQQTAVQRYARLPADADFWRIPPGDPGAARVLDGAVYSRGAMALHALRVKVGDEDFFAALRTWTTERRGGNGAVQDFLTVLERVSGEQVDDVAQVWLFSPTRPPTPPG